MFIINFHKNSDFTQRNNVKLIVMIQLYLEGELKYYQKLSIFLLFILN